MIAPVLRLLALFLVLTAGADGAHAHAALVGSDPADGAVLDKAPAEAVLRFNEPVAPISTALVGGDGSTTAIPSKADGGTVTIPLPAGLADGTYALSWRVVSVDGHPIGGSLVFSVGVAPGPAPVVAAGTVDTGLRTAIIAMRIVIYLGLFLGIGGVFFAAFVSRQPEAAGRIEAGLLVAALLALPVSVGLQGADALGHSLAALGTGETWRIGFSTSWGTAALLGAAAVLAALAGLGLRGGLQHLAAIAALAGLGLALTSTGHASSASPQWLTRPAVFLHAVAIATWAGALIPLALLLRAGGGEATIALRRFSRIIPWGIAALLAAGAALAVVQLGRPQALWETAYGQVLLAKLVLLAVLFALAAANRWLLTAPVLAGGGPALRRLRWSVAGEIGLVLAILVVVPFWRFTPPPRSLAAVEAAPATVHVHGALAMADVSVEPGRRGPVRVTISVLSPDLGALDAKAVELTLSLASGEIEPIRREAKEKDGEWIIDDLAIPMAGAWTVTVAVLVTDFDVARLEGTLKIAP